MNTSNNTFKVRDLRQKEQYKIDDAYLNGYAKICGVYATAVYNSLARHANFHTQECFPSITLIGEQHSIGRSSVNKALKILELAKIIIKRRVGKTQNNEYLLVDKSEWIKKEELMQIISTKNKRGSKNKRYSNGTFKSDVFDTDITSDVFDTDITSPGYGHHGVLDTVTKDNKANDNKFKEDTEKFFETFWKEYPIKANKKMAIKAFGKIDPKLVPEIIDDVKKRKIKDRQWLSGYIPHASTYLNGERWNDEIISTRPQTTVLANRGPVSEAGKYDNIIKK